MNKIITIFTFVIISGSTITAMDVLKLIENEESVWVVPKEDSSESLPISLIDKIVVTKNRVTVTYDKKFKEGCEVSDFFVEYDIDSDLTVVDESITAIPAVLCALFHIWASDQEYNIDSLDKNTYEALQVIKQALKSDKLSKKSHIKRIRNAFESKYPQTDWTGSLIPRKLPVNLVKEPTTEAHLLCRKNEYSQLLSNGVVKLLELVYRRESDESLSFYKTGQDTAAIVTDIGFEEATNVNPISLLGVIAPLLFTCDVKTLVGEFPNAKAYVHFAGIKIFHDLFHNAQ